MLQDIAPVTFDNAYHGLPPRDDDLVVLFDGGSVLVVPDAGDPYALPTWSQVAAALEAVAHDEAATAFGAVACHGAPALEAPASEGKVPVFDPRFLFSFDGTACFLASLDTALNAAVSHALMELVDGACLVPEQRLHALQHGVVAFAGLFGLQLFRWYDTHRFCGRCATPLVHSAKERMVECPSCHTMTYPTISPAVIVAVSDGDKVLVARGKGRPKGAISLIAGFAEAGETIEQTVHREVAEEAGIRVKNLRFYKSQPWPLSSSLLMGFFAELDGPPQLTIQQEELDWAGWVDRHDLPVDDTNYSLTREMMEVLRTAKE